MRIDNVWLGIVIESAADTAANSRADRKIDSERFAYLIAESAESSETKTWSYTALFATQTNAKSRTMMNRTD